jgi:hypothetical protein
MAKKIGRTAEAEEGKRGGWWVGESDGRMMNTDIPNARCRFFPSSAPQICNLLLFGWDFFPAYTLCASAPLRLCASALELPSVAAPRRRVYRRPSAVSNFPVKGLARFPFL